MESLYKGKNAKSHFKQLSVTQDMTKNDRSEMQKKSWRKRKEKGKHGGIHLAGKRCHRLTESRQVKKETV